MNQTPWLVVSIDFQSGIPKTCSRPRTHTSSRSSLVLKRIALAQILGLLVSKNMRAMRPYGDVLTSCEYDMSVHSRAQGPVE